MNAARAGGTSVRFSLCLPTRGRVAAAQRTLAGIAETAEKPEDIEIILYADTDDPDSHAIAHPALRMVRLIRPRATMGVMTCEAFAASSGRYFMLLNDDVVFRTRGWDTAAAGAFGVFPDDIALVWANDLLRGGSFASLPCLSRTWCDLAGGPCPDEYIHDYIDTHIHDVFRILKRLGHDRFRYLPDVIIEHCCEDAGKTSQVPSAGKLHSGADQVTYIARAEQRELLAAELADYIRDRRAAVR